MADLAAQFNEFADEFARGYSPLYEHLSREIAADREILDLVDQFRHRPKTVWFLAAVQFLVLEHSEAVTLAVTGQARP